MLKIYGVPISVHTRKVIVVSIIKDLPYEVIPVVPVVPGSPPPNWHELSPGGTIPALSDGDFTVADSTAICTYLDHAYEAHPVYPPSARELAEVLSLEAYAGERLFRGVVRELFHEVFVHPKVQGRPTDEANVERVLTTVLPAVFARLDRCAAGEYLVGGTLSVADIAVVSNLLTFDYIGFDLDRQRYPALAALVDRVLAHPAFRQALRAERPVVDSMGLRGTVFTKLAA